MQKQKQTNATVIQKSQTQQEQKWYKDIFSSFKQNVFVLYLNLLNELLYFIFCPLTLFHL